MIATLDEIKSILSIADATHDAFITLMIPNIQEEIVNYCRNRFTNQTFGVYSCSLEFVSDSVAQDYILGDFTDIPFQAGAEIYIKGTKLNDGYYTISSKTDDRITVTAIGTMIDETIDSLSEYVYINQTKYSSVLKLAMAYMIQSKIDSYPNNIQSEKMGEYSVSYATPNGKSYSDSIMSILDSQRRVVW
jgi:hypothetical protein